MRARIRWPSSGGPLTNAQLLPIMDDVLQSEVFPRVLEAKEDYRVYFKDYTLTADQAEYRLPPRAHAGRLKDVQIVDASGNAVSVPQIDLEQIADTHAFSTGNIYRPRAFYWRDDWIGLHPAPRSTGEILRLYYYMRPGELVLEASAATVSDVTGELQSVISMSGVPGTWSEGDEVDIIGGTGGFPTLHMEEELGDLLGSLVVTLPVDENQAQVGDWVALAGQSPIPQIPDVAFPLLTLRTAAIACEVTKDTQGASVQSQLADRAEAKMAQLLQMRIDGEPKIVTPEYSPLRQTGAYYRRWR